MRFCTNAIHFLRHPESSIKRNAFILSICILSTLLFSLYFTAESITPDGSNYMILGKHISEGKYTYPFMHRMPLIPVMFSILHNVGFGTTSILFSIPLFFFLLSLISTYLLGKELGDEKLGVISTLALFSFPEFWRWGVKFLTDIPLLAFSTLSIFLLIRSLKNEKYSAYFGISIFFGILTKASFMVVIAIMLLYIVLFRREKLISKYSLKSFLFPIIAFCLIFLFVTTARTSNDLSTVNNTVSNLFGSGRITPFMQIVSGQYGDIYSFLNFILFPLLILLPIGIYAAYKSNKYFLLLFFFVFFASVFFTQTVRLRYYSPLYPAVCIFAAYGVIFLEGLLKKGTQRKILFVLFALLMFISLVNSCYMMSLDHNMYSGANTLSSYTSELDGLILTYYIPSYINLTNDVVDDAAWIKNITSANDIYTDEKYGSRIKYVIISVYDEFTRNPSNETYHPTFGPVEIPFVERPYTGERVPKSYTFGSDLYISFQNDSRFSLLTEIYVDGQKKFIIYEVAE